jgi:putative integral membrane protein (TIGR02587 family)
MVEQSAQNVIQSLREYARGIAGGLMFSLPLLYTMEVWWAGFWVSPIRVMICMGCTFILLLGYNNYAGMRPDASWTEVAIDSVEELGLGLLVSAGALLLIGRISWETSVSTAVAKIVIEAMAVAIGISVGTSQLGMHSQKTEGPQKKKSLQDDVRFGGELVLAGCGGVLFAANIAPTEEVVVIAMSSSIRQLFLFMGLSILLTALILYYVEFSGSAKFQDRRLRSVLTGTVASYAVTLVTTAAVLWFFGRFDQASLITATAEVIVLAFPTSLGASAGRLLVQ